MRIGAICIWCLLTLVAVRGNHCEFMQFVFCVYLRWWPSVGINDNWCYLFFVFTYFGGCYWESMIICAICILCLLTLAAASGDQCEVMLFVFCVYLLWWLLVGINENWCYVYCVFTYFGGC
jgi:hypothetical protein